MFGSTDHSKQVVVGEQGERRTPRAARTARNRETRESKEPRESGNCNSQRTTRTGKLFLFTYFYCDVNVTSVVKFLHRGEATFLQSLQASKGSGDRNWDPVCTE